MNPGAVPVEAVSLPRATGELRISLREFRGRELADVRVFYRAADGELRPSRQGVAVPIGKWPEFRAAVAEFDRRLGAALAGQGDPEGGER